MLENNVGEGPHLQEMHLKEIHWVDGTSLWEMVQEKNVFVLHMQRLQL